MELQFSWFGLMLKKGYETNPREHPRKWWSCGFMKFVKIM